MRPLSPDEQALWRKVVDSVKPLHGAAPDSAPAAPAPAAAPEAPRVRRSPASLPPPPPSAARGPGTTLDGGWDRRLSRGLVQPDFVLDLHGHDLATAWELLDRRLEQAIDSGARLLLLVTGKPPGPARPVVRGRIRAAVGDWLAASRHAGAIAAVRGAHRRHGGSGALYIILRRRR
jgi:DNA-nicking Smr family endonuclease